MSRSNLKSPRTQTSKSSGLTHEEQRPLTSSEHLSVPNISKADNNNDGELTSDSSFSDHEASFDQDPGPIAPQNKPNTNHNTNSNRNSNSHPNNNNSGELKTLSDRFKKPHEQFTATNPVVSTPRRHGGTDSFRNAYRVQRQKTSKHVQNWRDQSKEEKFELSLINCAMFCGLIALIITIICHIITIIYGELMYDLFYQIYDYDSKTKIKLNNDCNNKGTQLVDTSNKSFNEPKDIFVQLIIVGSLQLGSLLITVIFMLIDVSSETNANRKKQNEKRRNSSSGNNNGNNNRNNRNRNHRNSSSGSNSGSNEKNSSDDRMLSYGDERIKNVFKLFAAGCNLVYLICVVWIWVLNGYYIGLLINVRDYCDKSSKIYKEMNNYSDVFLPFVVFQYLLPMLLCFFCCCMFAKASAG